MPTDECRKRANLRVVLLGNFIALTISGFLFIVTDLYGKRIAVEMEAWLSPVLKVNRVEDITRDEIKACFALINTKIADHAVPVKYEFFAETRLSAKIPVAAYVVDRNREKREDLSTHKPGTTWRRDYCFEIPSTIGESQNMRITGFAYHDRHPFYYSETKMPAFIIPSLPPLPQP